MQDSLAFINDYIRSHIPLTAAMQLSVTSFDQGGLILEAPLDPNINDKGTAFGGSLSAMLILAGWALTMLAVRDAGFNADVVVYSVSIDYRKPVTGNLTAQAAMPDASSKEKFLSDFKEKGKAKWMIECTAFSGAGEPAVICSGKYAAFIR